MTKAVSAREVTINALQIEVHYLEVATGERAVDVDDYEWRDAAHAIFMYEDGNYSCDCNRELFFDRALGREERDSDACTEGRFVIEKIVDRSTGQTIWSELSEVSAMLTASQEGS